MTKILFGALITAALAAPLAAREKPPVFVETAPVKDKPTVVLDPSKAYVLLRSEMQMPLMLMKVPTSEDQARYDTLRADAFIEAREKYAKKLDKYRKAKAEAAKTAGYSVPEEPVEPTEANFEFTAFGMMSSVGIGPANRFAKAKGASTYLQEMTPGTYRIYGMLSAAPGVAAIGSCFCMGSVRFDAKAGEITDLGVNMLAEPAPRTAGDSSQPVDLSSTKMFEAAPAEMGLDSRLAGIKIVPARFSPVGKLPNYFGTTISRIPEMPGVLRYERDRILDLTNGN